MIPPPSQLDGTSARILVPVTQDTLLVVSKKIKEQRWQFTHHQNMVYVVVKLKT